MMQLMDETARDMGVRDVFDPAENIKGGCKYLRYLIDRFGESSEHVLAGYNAGPSMVEKYRGVPPFAETIRYVRKVKAKHREYDERLRGAAAVVRPTPRTVALRKPLRVFVDASGVIHLTNDR